MIVGHVVELMLLSFHISVLVCVLKERRSRTATFRSGFFTIYCVQSVADMADYILVSASAMSREGFLAQVRGFGWQLTDIWDLSGKQFS